MALYHLSDDGPRACKAVIGTCPYARDGGPHFETQEEAQEAYEGQMLEQHGELLGGIISRAVERSPLQRHYRTMDRLSESNPLTRAIANHRTMRMHVPTRANIARQKRRQDRARMLALHRKRLALRSRRFLARKGREFVLASAVTGDSVRRMLMAKYHRARGVPVGVDDMPLIFR